MWVRALTDRGGGLQVTGVSALDWFHRVGPSGFGHAATASEVTRGLDLSGQTYLVTGCTSGLGQETLRVLTSRGARVLATGRSAEKAQRACAESGALAVPLSCDLSEPKSVLECVRAVRDRGEALTGIICNAGLMLHSGVESKYGYELQFLTNHIGHFLLVTQLLGSLSDRARVVMVSSEGHRLVPKGGIAFDNLSAERRFRTWQAYGQSKLANLLFAKELARRFTGTQRTANAVHPGVIYTNLSRHLPALLDKAFGLTAKLLSKTPAQGAATQCYVATHPDVAADNGFYFADCQHKQPSQWACDAALAGRLWEVSESITRELTP